MIDVDTMVNEMRTYIGVNSSDTDWPTSTCVLLLNQSYWDILNQFPFREKEGTATFTTVGGTNSYSLPVMFEAMQAMFIDNPITGARTQINRMDIDVFESSYNTNAILDGNYQAEPEFYVRRKDKILLYKTPDQAYTVTVLHLLTLADLAAGNSPDVPREWGEAILYGGVYRAWLRAGDTDRAANFINLQSKLINTKVPVENKEEADSRYAGIAVFNQQNTPEGKRRLWR